MRFVGCQAECLSKLSPTPQLGGVFPFPSQTQEGRTSFRRGHTLPRGVGLFHRAGIQVASGSSWAEDSRNSPGSKVPRGFFCGRLRFQDILGREGYDAGRPRTYLGMARNQRAGVTRVLVFGSIYQGAILVPLFERQHIFAAGSNCGSGVLRRSSSPARASRMAAASSGAGRQNEWDKLKFFSLFFFCGQTPAAGIEAL